VSLRDAANARHDLSGRAVSALEAFVLDEGRLQRMKFATLHKALDRCDLRSVVHNCQSQTGNDPLAVEQDCARSAGALIATLFGPGQVEMFPQSIKQRGAWIKLKTS
jgi:hypothetical protein